MNKRMVSLALVLFAAASSLFAQILSISASATDGTVEYSNKWWGWSGGNPTWIDGTVTVTRSSISTNTPYTIDLAPKSDGTTTTCPRNVNWTYYSTSGTSSTVTIDNAEIYSGTSHSTSSTNVLKLWDKAGIGDASVTTNNVFSGTMTGSTTSVTYHFSAVFWHESNLAGGFYELPITFRVRNESFASNSVPATDPVASQTITLRFIVGNYATIYFKDSTNSYELYSIQFDNITSNATKNFNLHIQSNFKYYVRVRSTNGGKLRHERYGASTNPVNEQVSYTLTYNGSTYPLASGTSYTLTPSKQSTTGFGTDSNSYPITLTLGTIDNLTAGEFSDSLAFTVTAQ